MSDSLSFDFDAHNSSAAVYGGDNNTNRANSIAVSSDIQGSVAITNGGSSGVNSFLFDTDFNPENYSITGITLRDGFKENEMTQLQLSGMWTNLNEGLISTVSFGVSRVDNDFQKDSTRSDL